MLTNAQSLARAKRIDFIKHIAIINCVLGILFASFIFVYLLKTNDLTASGYRLKELQDQKETLENEGEALSVELSKLEALPSVAAKIKDLGLAQITAVSYLSPPTSSPLVYDESSSIHGKIQAKR